MTHLTDDRLVALYDQHRDHPALATSARSWWRVVQAEGLGLTREVARALHRYARTASSPSPSPPPEDKKEEKGTHLAGEDLSWVPEAPQVAKAGRYSFDGSTYLTVLPEGRTVSTTLDQHQRIQSLYMSMGEGRTQLELCRILGWSLADVRAYLKAHRIQKPGLPIPHELVAAAETDEDLEVLASNETARSYGKLTAKILTAQRRRDASDALRWRQWEHTVWPMVRDALLTHASTPPVIPRVALPTSRTPWSLLAGVTDFHWGMRSWPHESGFAYSRPLARARLERLLGQLVVWMERHGAPDRILLPIGSDWLHVDGIGKEAATTRGTPQHVDGTPGEIFVTGLDLLRETVTGLSQIAPVLAVPCRGNHDDHSALSLVEVLRERARWDGRLEVAGEDRRLARALALVEQGTLLGVKHGHTGRGGPHSKARVKADAAWLAMEGRRLGYRGRHRVVVGGHTHHLEVEGDEGTRHVTLRALCDPDQWHADSGYLHTPPGLNALVLEQGRGHTHTLLFVEE